MTAAIQRPPSQIKKAASSTRPLEIVVVTHYFGTHGGGIELVAERLIREIAHAPLFHFTWIASDCDPALPLEEQTLCPMKTCNVFEKTLGIPWPLWGWKSLHKMREAIRKADVVWLHDTLYPGNILAYRAARKAKKPILIAQHIAPVPFRNPLLRWAMYAADRLIAARMLKNANEVVFISDRVAEDYYQRVPFSRPIKIIPNGVDINIFHPAITENRRFLRQQFALKNRQPVILFVGRFVEKKGMDVIRRLAKKLPEWRFWLAGNGRIDPNKWLLPNVHVMHNRKGASLAELYQAADVLALPSYGEGFPLVIQEAMACGLPVLCSKSTAQGNIQAMPYLHVEDVFPEDPEKTAQLWFEKLKSFPRPLPLNKPQEELSDFALTSWDWPPIAQVYADILKGMVKAR